MMNIAILDDYQDIVRQLDCFALLAAHQVTVYNDTVTDHDRLVERLHDQDAVVLIRERSTISAALLAALPRLKLISQTGKISNHIRLQDCTDNGIAFAEGRGSPIAPAELCWSLIMAASRQLPGYLQQLRQGRWQQSGPPASTPVFGRTLKGLTLGIWGYGKIGQRIARYAQAFEMSVLVWGSRASRDKAVADGFEAAEDQSGFFQQADIISLHLRLNAATRHIIDANDLAQMRPDALLVNTSRAELIQPGALVAALQAGRPGFAAVDVYDTEPSTPQQERLMTLPNVLCTPHLGYVEQNSYALYFRIAFDNINAFFAGQAENIANPEVLDTVRH